MRPRGVPMRVAPSKFRAGGFHSGRRYEALSVMKGEGKLDTPDGRLLVSLLVSLVMWPMAVHGESLGHHETDARSVASHCWNLSDGRPKFAERIRTPDVRGRVTGCSPAARSLGGHSMVAFLEARAAETGPGGVVTEEVYRGIYLIALPPDPAVEYDVSLVDQRSAIEKVRSAIDLIYRESSFSANAIERMKVAGKVIILYDPGFPWKEWRQNTRLVLALFMPVIPKALASRYPDAFERFGDGRTDKIFLAVLGRNVIKHPLPDLAGGGIVHELVGHGMQHLRDRLEGRRQLDVECEASLYELNAYQDFKMDKFAREMILFRKELQEFNCDDFRRYMRKNTPSMMKLWDELNLECLAYWTSSTSTETIDSDGYRGPAGLD